SLAATLIHDPELIFLDEPTAGIDPVLRQKFWNRFRELSQSGRTLFVTTQYVSEANYCDLVGVMAEGALLMVDTPAGLRHRAYGGEIIDLRASEPLDYQVESRLRELPFVKGGHVSRTSPNSLRLTVDEASTAIPTLLEWCRDNNIPVESVEEFTPPFDDVFVELVQPGRSHA
ncbi:MAG TPA: AAA family ATPase, partial [Anaerolineales bacterium]